MKVTPQMLDAAMQASHIAIRHGHFDTADMYVSLRAAFALLTSIKLPREQIESTPGGDYYNYSVEEVKQAITDAGYIWSES